jgi:obg-like ATPase 1
MLTSSMIVTDLLRISPSPPLIPEESRVLVPDDRFDWLCEKYQPKSRVPAHLTIYDIAGLTRGASTGAGLGNAFLSHIRAVDAIFQVVRCFDDAEIIHIEGDVDPVRDLTIISEELRIKDIEFTEKALDNYEEADSERWSKSRDEEALRKNKPVSRRCWLCYKEAGMSERAIGRAKEVRTHIFLLIFFNSFFPDDKGPRGLNNPSSSNAST